MGDIKLLLGNSAPVEVHRAPLEPDLQAEVDRLQGRTPSDAPADADRVQEIVSGVSWHERARGDVETNWNNRGPHRVHQLDVVASNTTEIVIPDGDPIRHVLANITHLWDYHSTANAGYVTVLDDGGDPQRAELIRAAIADHFGVPTPTGPVALVTNAGLDYASAQLGGSASTSVAKYCAITANATAPAAGDTTLTGEITTGGGGLVRAAGVYAHTAGASTYTLTVTFTANGSDSLPVTINKAAWFTASSAGTMPFEDAISPAITFNGSGDAGTLTETVTV